MVGQLKSVAFEYQFHNEPLRMLLTMANATGFSTLNVYSQPNNLKFFLRRSRIHEGVVQGVKVGYNTSQGHWVVDEKLFQSTTRDSDDEDDSEEGDSSGKKTAIVDAPDDLDVEEEAELQENASSARIKGTAQELWKDLQHDPKIDAIKLKPPTKYNPANDMFYAGLLLASNTGVPSMGKSYALALDFTLLIPVNCQQRIGPESMHDNKVTR